MLGVLDKKLKERGHCMVLVEDNEDDEALSLRAVRKCGVDCDVSVIRHGGEAITRLVSEEGPVPSLIVLDFHLPGYNGLEILRELRKHKRTCQVPIVMLSALESDREVGQCLDEGANSCVKKPIDMDLYIERVGLIVRYWLTVDERPDR
jgi:DNA-binding response OmpR family regulator